MPKNSRLIRVFVSSPSDVSEERREVDSVVTRINATLGDEHGFRLETWRYEKDARPRLGMDDSAQRVVDDQLPDYDIYVGILASRFGTPTGGYGSGTEKEFRDAVGRREREGRPEVLFYFRTTPPKLTTQAEALEFGRVLGFKSEIGGIGLYAEYEDIHKGDAAFVHVLQKHLTQVVLEIISDEPNGGGQPRDPTRYLQWLHRKCSRIDIRGLNVGRGQVHHLPIEELYIQLKASFAASQDGQLGKTFRPEHEGYPRSPHLQRALQAPRLVVVGDPGAGKTTFLRRVTWELCRNLISGHAFADAWRELQSDSPRLPVFISLAELYDKAMTGRDHGSTPDTSAGCLANFLGVEAEHHNWGLDAGFFQQRLEDGQCFIMLDGLDEAPHRLARKSLVELIENVAGSYPDCRLVVTSRPAAFVDQSVLPQPEFAHASIEPLDDAGVESFLSRWCQCLYVDEPLSAEEHCRELLASFRAKPEIRRMARNPVMLTALAVVHWNERTLPEQRAELYKSVLRWLARSREQRGGRLPSEACLKLLRQLAFAMQNHPKGPQVQVSLRGGAEVLMGRFDDDVEKAEDFLSDEQIDSGIILGRGNELRFWHRTFQEYLAAVEMGAWIDSRQMDAVRDKWRIPEWREVLLLLAGVLHDQGQEKVDLLFETVLEDVSDELADAARAAGLLGGMVRDLTPLHYEPPQTEYRRLLDQAMAIFDPQRCRETPIRTRIEAADALGKAGDPRINPRRDDYWVVVPAGEFRMGSQKDDTGAPNYDEEALDTELPPHDVYLDEFSMARYPITVDQYREFIEDEGYDDQLWWEAGGFGKSAEPQDWKDQREFPNRPVVGVSWFEAAAFCAWSGSRLPTEAEWERAARGPGATARRFPWGNEAADSNRLNYNYEVQHPTPVGIFPLGGTPEGIQDLAGNVWEWCADWYAEGYYVQSPTKNPLGPSQATSRVIRGGSWWFVAGGCRAAVRNRGGPASRGGSLGFRVVAVPLGGAGR